MIRVLFRVAFFLCLPILRGAEWHPPGHTSIPLTVLENDWVRYLHLRIGGETCLAMIDLGADDFAILNTYADRYPLPEKKGYAPRFLEVELPGGRSKTIAFTTADYRALAEGQGGRPEDQRTQAILGGDILQTWGCWIDYRTNCLWIPEDGVVPESPLELPELGPVIPLERDRTSHYVFLSALINGRSARLILDTGCDQTAIHRRAVPELGLLAQPVDGQVQGLADAPYSMEAAMVDSIQIGDRTSRQFPVVLIDLPLGNLPVHGLLGGDFLQKNGAIIDVATPRLILPVDYTPPPFDPVVVPFPDDVFRRLPQTVKDSTDIFVGEIAQLEVRMPEDPSSSAQLEFTFRLLRSLEGDLPAKSEIVLHRPVPLTASLADDLTREFSHSGNRQLVFLHRGDDSTRLVDMQRFNALRAQLVLRTLGKPIED